ncbi:MAG: Maf family protein [Polyangiaceae bacterium]
MQGGAAGFVLRIEGSYTSVVGLPLAEVIAALRVAGLLPCAT